MLKKKSLYCNSNVILYYTICSNFYEEHSISQFITCNKEKFVQFKRNSKITKYYTCNFNNFLQY